MYLIFDEIKGIIDGVGIDCFFNVVILVLSSAFCLMCVLYLFFLLYSLNFRLNFYRGVLGNNY